MSDQPLPFTPADVRAFRVDAEFILRFARHNGWSETDEVVGLAKDALRAVVTIERLERRLVRTLDDRYDSTMRDERMLERWGLETVWGPDFTEEAPSMLCLCSHRTKDHVAHHVGGTPTYYRGDCGVDGCGCLMCKVTTVTFESARQEARQLRMEQEGSR